METGKTVAYINPQLHYSLWIRYSVGLNVGELANAPNAQLDAPLLAN